VNLLRLVLMDWNKKVKVQTPFGYSEDVSFENIIRVYRKPYDRYYSLERSDGVDATLADDEKDYLFDNYPEVFERPDVIDWERNYEQRVAEMFDRLRNM